MGFHCFLPILLAKLAMNSFDAAKSTKNSTPKADKCAATALTTEFSASFRQPDPPEIEAEFGANVVPASRSDLHG
ncbi:hypothetical protein ACJZ2D_015400 [Fusarium nematophilum]